jgi:hypothetical protein
VQYGELGYKEGFVRYYLMKGLWCDNWTYRNEGVGFIVLGLRKSKIGN